MLNKIIGYMIEQTREAALEALLKVPEIFAPLIVLSSVFFK